MAKPSALPTHHPQPRELVGAYLAAIAARDFDRARTLLADDEFSTRSPIAITRSAEEHIASISRVGPILERVELRKMFVDGNDVCAVLNFVVHMDKRQAWPVVQLFRVERGKITYIESFFDATEYVAMFNVD